MGHTRCEELAQHRRRDYDGHMRFTLDHNCIIALANGEPAAPHIKRLADAHTDGIAEVAVLGISASERQLGGRYLDSILEFRSRLSQLNLGNLTIHKPTGIWGITFWGWCVHATDESEALEREIHAVMFPNTDFDWVRVALAAGEAVDRTDGPAYRKWRNRRCDVQGMLAHIMNDGDVFVSSDDHFLRNAGALTTLGAGRVVRPVEAADLINHN